MTYLVEDDPFSDWSELVHQPVYSIDGKKLGFLRKTISEYIIVGQGLINLTKYFIPKSLAESTSKKEIVIYTARDLLTYALIPVGMLAILSQLGGVTVLMGAGLFAINRVNLGKFLVMIGTGQGLFTIGLRILSELWSGRLSLENNYI